MTTGPLSCATDLKRGLSALLNQDPAAVSRNMREKYDRLAGRKGESIVLFGAGVVGRIALEGLRRAGLEPKAFADNNPQLRNTTVDGVPVLPAADAVRKFDRDCAFVVTIYNGRTVREQLRSLGCSTAIPFDCLFLKYSDLFIPHMSLDLPDEIFLQAGLVEKAFDLWADEPSRVEYVAQLKYRTTLDSRWTREYDLAEDTYFPKGLAHLTHDEVFVDCGAFDGDSLHEFLQRSGGNFQRALAIEPDRGTFLRLREFLHSLPLETQEKVRAFNVALGRTRQTVSFQATGTVYSRVAAGSGSEQVACETLDSLLEGYQRPYIKMDIEGAELEALAGAARTLAAGSATLAICNHHTQDDLWKVPLAIDELSGGRYKLYLRRNAEDCWENMCHAIPQ
jgi:FkbM family methyltransferase